MATFKARTSISHGQGRGDKKQIWNISKGMRFNPADMDMSDETVDNLLRSNVIERDDSGDAPTAKPQAAPPPYVPRAVKQLERATGQTVSGDAAATATKPPGK